MSTDYYLVCPSCRERLNCGNSRGLYNTDTSYPMPSFAFLIKHEGHTIYFEDTDGVCDKHISPTLTTSYDPKEHGWTDFEGSVS